MKISSVILFIFISLSFEIVPKFLYNKTNADKIGRIHFLNTGSSDAFLLESEGKYGIVDSANPYIYSEHEVEKVVIDPSKGEKDQGTTNPNISVQRVVEYLQYLGVKKLEFIIGTHAHSDHIGGVPALAYYFVDNSTYYYYKSYVETHEDHDTDWANKAYYTAACNSMKKKGAQLVDVTGKDISFNLGKMQIKLLATEPKDCYSVGENCFSIVQLITIGSTRIFLEADLHNREDKKITGKVGIIDVFKVGHHGYAGSGSYEFISGIKPKVAILPATGPTDAGKAKIAYMENKFKTKVYVTKGAGDEKGKVAILLNLYSDSYDLENTGANIDISGFNGWAQWNDKWAYLVNGNLLTGWRDLSYLKYDNLNINSEGIFYFDDDGIMQISWQKLTHPKLEGEHWFFFDESKGAAVTGWQYLGWTGGNNWFYFDKTLAYMYVGWQELSWSGGVDWFYFDLINGFMLTGWQTLQWSKGTDTFYFDPTNGYMLRNCCRIIDGKQYCFDENGVLIQ